MDSTEILARNMAAWNARAPDWDAMAETNRQAPDRAAAITRIMTALNLAPGDRVLDAGCGSGQYALDFAANGATATGIDLAATMIERARAHATAANLAVAWHVGDLSALPFPDGAFDAVFARVSLQFVPAPATALREFHRVVRPGGRLLVAVPGALSPIYLDSWERFLNQDRPPLNGIMPWELERLLPALDFTLREAWGDTGPDGRGRPNPLSPDALAALPIPLQQAAATIWTVIADR